MNYLNVENYQAVNEKLSQQISDKHGFPIKVRAFENSLFAGFDLCFGLLQFLSHKPKVGIVRLGSSLQENLLPQFYRLQTPIVFKKENENIQQYISQLDHEMNFVVWSSENEITGEVILSPESRSEIHRLLSSKRIFSIELKSNFDQQDVENLKQFAYGVVVETGTLFHADQCLVYHTEKLKTPSLVGHFQENLHPVKNFSFKTISEHKNVEFIKKFNESKLNYYNRFASHPVQLKDRLVLFSKTVSGAALKAELGLNEKQAFAPSELPSWIIETIPSWWPEARSHDLVMGLLIIHLDAVSDDLLKKLNESHDKLTSLSSWSIS